MDVKHHTRICCYFTNNSIAKPVNAVKQGEIDVPFVGRTTQQEIEQVLATFAGDHPRRVPSFCLFTLYSQPAFYTRYIVYAAMLLIATSKWIFGQKHRCIKVYEREAAQACGEMGGS